MDLKAFRELPLKYRDEYLYHELEELKKKCTCGEKPQVAKKPQVKKNEDNK